MPYEITRESDHLLHVSLVGALVVADLRELAREIGAIEAALPVAPHRLCDLDRCTGVDIGFPAVYDFTLERSQVALRNPIKAAVVASDQIHYGFARMFQTFNRNPSIMVAIFPTEQAAREWLAVPGAVLPENAWAPSPTPRSTPAVNE